MNPNLRDQNRAETRPANIRAVVFDWAGTIVDFGSCAPVATFIEAFARNGVEVSTAAARAPMGMAKRQHIAAIGRTAEVAVKWRERHSCDFGEQEVDRVYQTFLPLQEACVTEYSAAIEGAVDVVRALRARGIKIGSSTGYTSEIMQRLMPLAREQGLEVDAMVCASDFPEGRPWPWMIFENMRRLKVCPPSAVVTVDDTTVGVEAGRNAGTWTIGVAASGNLVGLSPEEFAALSADDRERRISAAKEQLLRAGAHVVVDTVAQLPEAIDVLQEVEAG